MTTFYLIRHGMCDAVGRMLAGRMPGVHLNRTGISQVTALGGLAKRVRIEAVYCSPLERAIETAAPFASCGIPASTREWLNEIDYGEWTGKSFEELGRDPRWPLFNEQRDRFAVPSGEHFIDVQARMARGAEELRALHTGTVVLVSHGDPLKLLIAYYAGMPLPVIQRFSLFPGSLSVVVTGDADARVHTINLTGIEAHEGL